MREMGCGVEEENDGIVVKGPKNRALHGIHVKMTDFSDQTMTLAAIAPFAEGETVIDGIEHIPEKSPREKWRLTMTTGWRWHFR